MFVGWQLPLLLVSRDSIKLITSDTNALQLKNLDITWCNFSAQETRSFFPPIQARINFLMGDRDYYGSFSFFYLFYQKWDSFQSRWREDGVLLS